MSQIFSGIAGAVAVSLTFGAMQFASGSDLMASRPGTTHGVNWTTASGAGQTVNEVNRIAKSDRGDWVRAAGQSQTIAVHSDGLAETSVLIRRPAELREEARNRPSLPGPAKPAISRRTTVACEPVVSVLTEVAKLLQPGRCIT
jgi:hypothetical protein